MSLRSVRVLYTGVWASGYMRGKDTFSRVSIKDISLVVHLDNTFNLTADTVYSEESVIDPFLLTGKAQVLYESNGDVGEILLSEVSYKNCTLEHSTIFSVNRKKCTRLPIPCGEAFFCFSSRLPPIDFNFQPETPSAAKALESEDIEDIEDTEDIKEMSFEDLFESFSTPDMPVDFSTDYCSS